MSPRRRVGTVLLALSAGALLGLLPACTSDSNRKQVEQITKANPLDMANEDAKTVVIQKEQKKPQYPKVPTIDARTAPFVSGKNTRIFHVRGCEYAKSIDSPIGFASAGEAQRSGRIPCEFCHPIGEVSQ